MLPSRKRIGTFAPNRIHLRAPSLGYGSKVCVRTRPVLRFALPLSVSIVALLACSLPGGLGPGSGTQATDAAAPLQPSVPGPARTQAPTITPLVIFTLTPAPAGDAGQPATEIPTLAANEPATPAGACDGDSLFVADVNIPDNTPIAANTSFTKTWRMRNTGTCTWDSGFTFRFIAGEPMGAPGSISLSDTVPPGVEVDISVQFVAPTASGTYRSQWQIFLP